MRGYTDKISCLCGEDIDQHTIRYNELTGEFISGPCVKKDCGCLQFRLAYPLTPLSTGQLARLQVIKF